MKCCVTPANLKLFSIQACFALPADFDGDTADALQLLAQYDREHIEATAIEDEDPTPENIYRRWWNLVHSDDPARLVMASSLSKLDDAGRWKPLNEEETAA